MNLTKIFPGRERPALDGLTASIRKGIITGLVGPDAAGKTTLIRLIAGLLLPTQGHIHVLGLDTKIDADRLHEITGYMPQKFGLYEDLTVIENLNLYASLHNLKGHEKEATFDRMLTFTSLKPFIHRLAANLSGGMKQKLGLACALLGQPQVLLLDEPGVGVDPLSRRELWKMIQDLVQQGITVVWSTSYLDEADKCQEILLLNEGKLLFYGPPQDLTQRVKGRVFQVSVPLHERRTALKQLLTRPDIIDGVIQGKKIRLVVSPSFSLSATDLHWRSTKPRFEDAFVDILGGGSEGKSALAEKIPRKGISGAEPIKAEHLTKQFGHFIAAENISFTIKRGEIFGLLGPNGAGKSTIFKMLCGLLQPTKGRALVSGLDLKTAPSKARSRIGYMAQKFSLYSDLSVEENLDFFSGVYGLQGKNRQAKIDQMISVFDLSFYLNSNAGLLPLGYKQRLSLACAVMHEPDVLFLDEPTSGVDPLTRREFWTHINGMVEKGVTIMVTTHFMEEAEYCDRIALIYGGLNIATGTPDELKESVKTKDLLDPTLEDMFIALIERSDALQRQHEGQQ
ncbi:MAG: ABC transporter ATP-binding protein [Alphaproteobacteria bacterium]|jgi:ABC-2 type transport system ATP-binding protein|nr:ABC transporter ATP-binding protein [Alphaproteobacteria bacterium]MBP7729220.1 ABC transporter ATP-binding protein [Alphaproteobacteria bacterium]